MNDLSSTDSLNMSMALIDRMEGTPVRGGKKYHDVSQRIEAFRAFHPRHQIKTDMIANDGKMIVFKASIFDPDGKELATGHAEEVRGSSNVNKTSALENCETSSIGRALAQMGLHGGEFASLNELMGVPDKAEKLQQWDHYQQGLKNNIHPHPFEETEGFKQIKEVLPNATVTKTQPHGSFLQEHQEKWQSVTTADLLKIAAQDKAKLGEVLKRWRDEALAVFEICTTQEQYAEVEKRFHAELTEIRNIGKGGSAWADKCFDAMVPQLTNIAERVSDNEINEKSKVYL
jgi:hypothetical protein